MIHYTLLPEQEIKKLKREYRVRLAIVLLLFISSAIVLGVLTLLPSYIVSRTQFSQAREEQIALQKSRKASGAEQIEKDLQQVQKIAENIITDKENTTYSDVIKNIISYDSGQVSLTTFEFSHSIGTSSPVSIIVQGKSLSREALVAFKNGLDASKKFTSVELPVSDLAKSKDLSFALKITLNRDK